MLSKLHIFSLGVVVKDKEEDSNFLYVIPYETLTDLDGELANYTESVNKVITEESGTPFDGADKAAELKCEWLPFGDLRTTSPDMVLGEQVIVWRYAKEDDYYWTPKRQDLLNRKLEHIVFTLCNTPDDQDESKTDDKSYTITLSTRNKMLSIETDDNDKEKAKYLYSINTKEGIVSLSDNHDNEWTLNSVDRKLYVKTGAVVYDCNSFKCTGTMDVLKVTTLHDNVFCKKNVTISGNNTVSGTGKYSGALSTGSSFSASSGGSFGGVVNAAHFVGSAGSVKYR